MTTTIQFKRKVPSSTYDEVLLEGEPLYDLASKRLYIGDGTSKLSELPFVGNYSTNASNVSDSIGGISLSNIFESDGRTVKSATVASKLGTTTIGDTVTPVYINNGVATPTTKYAGATRVTLNGVQYSGQDTTIFAPTTGGTSGFMLVSSGNASPSWSNPDYIAVGSATKATKDGLGNTISSTYGSSISGSYNDSSKSLTVTLGRPNSTSSSGTVTLPIPDPYVPQIYDGYDGNRYDVVRIEFRPTEGQQGALYLFSEAPQSMVYSIGGVTRNAPS